MAARSGRRGCCRSISRKCTTFAANIASGKIEKVNRTPGWIKNLCVIDKLLIHSLDQAGDPAPGLFYRTAPKCLMGKGGLGCERDSPRFGIGSAIYENRAG